MKKSISNRLDLIKTYVLNWNKFLLISLELKHKKLGLLFICQWKFQCNPVFHFNILHSQIPQKFHVYLSEKIHREDP